MSRRMAFLHLPPIRWLTSFYNPPIIKLQQNQMFGKKTELIESVVDGAMSDAIKNIISFVN